MLKRLRETDDKAYADRRTDEVETQAAPFDALSALNSMIGQGDDVAPVASPSPPSAAALPQHDDLVQSTDDAEEDRPQSAEPSIRAAVDGARPELAGLLEQVGPMFQAALVFPGASSPPTEFAAAIRRMSETTAALTRQVVQGSKEADEAWAMERVQPCVARLVAEEWRIVAMSVPPGGDRDSACSAAVAIDRLRGPVSAAMDVRSLLHVGGEASLPIEAVAVVARLCSEASMYAERVEQFVPGMEVSPDLFLLNAVQFAQAETAAFHARFPGATRDVGAAFLVHALQSVALAFGRHSRGILRAMTDAETSQKRAGLEALIRGDTFKSGFPTAEVTSDARTVTGRMAAMAAHVLRSLSGEKA